MQSSLFSEDMLGYLLGRAHYSFWPDSDQRWTSAGYLSADFFVLSLLSVREPLPAEDIAKHIDLHRDQHQPAGATSAV